MVVGRPRHMFPGLGLATGIFAVYLAGEYFYNKKFGWQHADSDHHGDAHGHGKEEHGHGAKPAHH